jgi:hypothetical protein
MTERDVLTLLVDSLRETVSDLRIRVQDLEADSSPAKPTTARCTSIAQVAPPERERDGNVICFPGTPLGHVLTMQGKTRPGRRRGSKQTSNQT